MEVEDVGAEGEENEEYSEAWEAAKEEVMDAVKKKFPPELINRLDDLLVFTPLKRRDLVEVVSILIKQVEYRLKDAQSTRETPLSIQVDLHPEACDFVVDEAYVRTAQQRRCGRRLTAQLRPRNRTSSVLRSAGPAARGCSQDPAFGVRPLRRYIEREIVTSLARAMVKGELQVSPERCAASHRVAHTPSAHTDAKLIPFLGPCDWGRTTTSCTSLSRARVMMQG
eukprot:SAG11_NODE_6403_length_1321_cov_0.905892_2_plen_225_part_00